MRLLERADAEGLVERVLYHSHCDAGAYFSPEDRAMAVVDGVELMPGVVHVVVSVLAGRAHAMAAYRYGSGGFHEQRVPLGSPDAWPDVEARAMTGRATSRPISPVGGRLVRRRVDAREEAAITAAIVGAVDISEADHVELRRLALGLWSPARGFDDGAAVSPRAESPRPALPEGAVVELRRGGVAVGALRLDGSARLAGEAVAYERALDPTDLDAADVRAELVRRGARRVVASFGAGGALALVADDVPVAVPAVARSDDPAVQAIMAQNLGATALRGPDRSLPAGVSLLVDAGA
jgi:hypothetical protein